jgi:hypothetical protein
MTIYRQGDVMIRKLTKAEAKKIKSNSKDIPRDNGRVVLAYGEVTGHAHAISEANVNFVFNEQALRILEIREPATIRHEEHRAFELPVGDYEVIIQREYTPAEIVNVAD